MLIRRTDRRRLHRPTRPTPLTPTACLVNQDTHQGIIIYFTSAAVAVDSSRMTASSFALWSRFSPPLNFVNGHVSTMWFMVCRWPKSQEGEWVRPNLCKLARPVWKSAWELNKSHRIVTELLVVNLKICGCSTVW